MKITHVDRLAGFRLKALNPLLICGLLENE